MRAIPKKLANLRDSDLARALGVSRQYVYQMRRQERGQCRLCSKPAEPEYAEKLCVVCREKVKEGQRKRLGK